MRSLWTASWVALTLSAGLAADCGQQPTREGSDEPGEDARGRTPPACDPDGVAPCPDSWFVCTEDEVGGKRCESEEAMVPDGGGGWDCSVEEGLLVCVGDHPVEGGGWRCEEGEGGEVACEREVPVPDDGSGGTWSCEYEGDLLVCGTAEGGGDGGGQSSDGTGDGGGDGTGDGGGDGTGDGTGDGGGDGTGDGEVGSCICIPGSWRYCDEPEYCSWGKQYCADDGLSWGPCHETTDVPPGCASERGFYDEDCCVEAGACCEGAWGPWLGEPTPSVGECGDVLCATEGP